MTGKVILSSESCKTLSQETSNYLPNFLIWISCCFWRALSLPHKNDLINFGRKYIWQNDINALKQIFKLNRYPIQFIDRCIKQLLQKLYVAKATKNTASRKQLVVFLMFLGSQSILFMKVV